MRTLLSLLSQPLAYTVSAAEFGAMRTEHSFLDFAETNEALKDFFNILIGSGQAHFSFFSNSLSA
jgi:hypothetical protein